MTPLITRIECVYILCIYILTLAVVLTPMLVFLKAEQNSYVYVRACYSLLPFFVPSFFPFLSLVNSLSLCLLFSILPVLFLFPSTCRQQTWLIIHLQRRTAKDMGHMWQVCVRIHLFSLMVLDPKFYTFCMYFASQWLFSFLTLFFIF